MSKSSEIRDTKRRNTRKRAELSLSVSLIGLITLLSPLVNSFTVVDGKPTIFSLLVYLFSVWAFLILISSIMSHFLAKDSEID